MQKLAIALALRAGAGQFDAHSFDALIASSAYEALIQTGVFAWPEKPDIGRCWRSAEERIQLGVQARRSDLARLPTHVEDRGGQPCVVMRWAATAEAKDADTRRFWHQWWHAANLLLCMSNAWAVADEDCSISALARAPAYRPALMSEDWEAVASYAASSVQNLIAELFNAGVTAPDVGFELLGSNGCVIAEAELAWTQLEVAVLLDESGRDAFEAAGWIVFRHSADGLTEALLELLK
jgi:DEAD/DEAH box helicase domain-containing protein